MKVLISGISGQDGLLLSHLLHKKGFTVVGMSRKANTKNHLNQKIYLTDYSTDSLMRLIEKIEPDLIYHLAGQSSVGRSWSEPISTLHGIEHCTSFLEAIRIINPKIKFINASSCEIYQYLDNDKLTEKSNISPSSPYGIYKAATHRLIQIYREKYNIIASNAILFPHESHLRPPHFLTKKLVLTAQKIRDKKINKLTLGNVKVIRDWGYAPDFVEALMLFSKLDIGHDINLCTGKARSVYDYAKEVFAFYDLELDCYLHIEKNLKRTTEPPYIIGSNKKAFQLLNWQPTTSFNQMINNICINTI